MNRILLSSLAAFAALSSVESPAHAQSIYSCEVGCEVHRKVLTTDEDVGMCKARCRNSGGASGQSSARYGAIAYDRHAEGWGYSDHWGSRAKAEAVAMSNCKAEGKACEVLVWFEHKCGAIAGADDDKAYSGLGSTDRAARADAMKDCAAAKARNCSIEVSHCSF